MADDDTNTAFPVDPQLTAIAVAYRNPDVSLIADAVLPRVSRPGTLLEYTSYDDIYQAYTLPNTKVGPKGKVNSVELGGRRVQASTEDNAIQVPLSHFDLNAISKGVDAKAAATEYATSIINLQHEVAVAALVFDAANYPAGFKETLAGDDQLNDAQYAGNPLSLISAGLDTALVRPNRLVFGHKAWSVFRSLPAVVKAVLGNSGDSGMATREQVARLFEVQEVLVGVSLLNISKPGEVASLNRVWGNHIAASYIDRAAAQVGGLTFGACFEYGTRFAGTIEDKDIGARGGARVRVAESTKPVIIAPHAAYFWEDVVA
jgi:hypothetical protein